MAIIGIDLGTTNSLVSIWRHGRAELIPNSLGTFLTPSVVSRNVALPPSRGRWALPMISGLGTIYLRRQNSLPSY